MVEEGPTEVVFDFIEFPIADSDAVAEVSSNSDSQPNKEDEVSGSMDGFYVYYSPNTKERCKWITRRMVASRVLMGISVILIGTAVLVCCLGVLRKDSSHVTGNKVSFYTIYIVLEFTSCLSQAGLWKTQSESSPITSLYLSMSCD